MQPPARGSRKRFSLATFILGSISGVLLWNLVVRDRLFPSRPPNRVQVEPEVPWPECKECDCPTEPKANASPPLPTPQIMDPLHPFASLNGPSTPSFRENLRNDTKYITSWGSAAGWTNDVITLINLVYLGLITDRTAILPVFMSAHLPGDPPPLFFGEAFDVPRLRKSLGKPVLEWNEVKQTRSPIVDEIGCWNTWESVQYNDRGHRHSNVPWFLNLDISWTKTPYWIKMIPNFEHDQHATFWSLAALAYPDAREANLVPPLPSPQHKVSLPPDEQLLCFDFLYYVAAQEPFEIGLDYSPAWRYVGQYMRFTPALEQLADEYVRITLEIGARDPIPPFISVHARHSDFKGWCGDFTPKECFAPISVLDRRVQEVRDEIWRRKGIMVHQVLITSDERDPAWWAEVAALGWRTPDHARLRTEEVHGVWFPVLLDAVIQSQGAGFVGTDRSTFSILSARRVNSWHDGPTRLVKWGRPGADDH
ncbi:hypothetical protein B0H16DRAFT_1536747 [Mycena metata]|uniref:Uncharacterized protein n=1 Tax=Mycena metata TaxID=1033252 RepID=A0AAD7J5X0_9AGAR|nr:hypothetical protein B0H16DRAFT_1536747 [Mycena metata]